jgi:hypothetical protein
MLLRTTFLCAAALLPAWAGASAQAADSTPSTPTCAEQGMQRLAVMVPPGRTADDVRELARSGSLAPNGTEVFIVPAGHFTRMRDEAAYRSRLDAMLRHFMVDGGEVQGTASILLLLDEDGAVTEIHPNTRNRRLDREMTRMWTGAAFEPYRIGGCRVPAWIHVPLTFASDFGLTHRRIQVKPGQP